VATGSSNGRWLTISRAAGLTIIALVILLRSAGLMEWRDAQYLLGIAAGLLGILGLLRR